MMNREWINCKISKSVYSLKLRTLSKLCFFFPPVCSWNCFIVHCHLLQVNLGVDNTVRESNPFSGPGVNYGDWLNWCCFKFHSNRAMDNVDYRGNRVPSWLSIVKTNLWWWLPHPNPEWTLDSFKGGIKHDKVCGYRTVINNRAVLRGPIHSRVSVAPMKLIIFQFRFYSCISFMVRWFLLLFIFLSEA